MKVIFVFLFLFLFAGIVCKGQNLSGSSSIIDLADSSRIVRISAEIASDSIANMKAGVFNVLDYGAISDDNTNDTTAINATIRAASTWGASWGEQGKVIVPPGIWNLSGPIKALNHVSIEFEDGGIYYVPSNYTGNAIELPDLGDQSNIHIKGMATFLESTPAHYKWTGINISKTTSSNSHNTNVTIDGLLIQRVGTGINISTSGGGWFNGNKLTNIKVADFKTGLKMDEGSGGSQIRGNDFDITFQAGDSTIIGVDNTTGGTDNNLALCEFWDFDASEKSNVKFTVEKSQSRNNYIGSEMIPLLETPYSEFANNAVTKKLAVETITFSQDGIADTIAFLDNLTIVWNICARQSANFNDSGTDLVDIGTGGDPDYFVNNLDVATGSGTFKTLTPATAWPIMIWNNNYIVVTYDGQNNNATTLSAVFSQSSPVNLSSYDILPSDSVESYLCAYAGAWYWNRDEYDRKAIERFKARQGNFINSPNPLPARAYNVSPTEGLHTRNGNMASGYNFSTTPVSFTVNGKAITLNTNLTSQAQVLSELNRQLSSGVIAVDHPHSLCSHIIIQTVEKGSKATLVISGNASVFGIESKTYYGND